MRVDSARRPRRPQRRAPMVLAMVLGLGSGLMLAAPLAEWLSTSPFDSIQHLSQSFQGWTGIGRRDVLVLGTDVDGGNTDVIATLRVEGGITRLTQIPRDTYIEAERFGPLKLNALYSLGGSDAVRSELAYHMGRPIDHYVVVNMAAISRMADVVGGIEVDVPKRMRYTDESQGLTIDLQPGRQRLRGRDLEGFLRFRHDEMGDLGRLDRQQLALQALFRKITRPDQIVRLPAVLMAAGKDISTDLGPMEIGGLITAMSGTQLETQRLGGRPFDLNGISYWEVDWPRGGDPVTSNGTGGESSGQGSPNRDDRYRFLF